MINLIKNEIYKIFHKKSTIVYLLIILFIMLSSTYIVTRIGESSEKFYPNLLESEQSIIDSFKDRKDLNEDEKLDYVISLTNYDVYKFIIDRNYSINGPETKYVDSTLRVLFNDKNTIKVYGEEHSITTLDEVNKKLEEAIKYLDKPVFIDLVKQDLANANKENVCINVKEEFCDKYFEEYKRVLQYRIDMNIPYSSKYSSNILDTYLSVYGDYLYHDKNKDILREEEEDQYRGEIETIKVTQYLMENKTITDDYTGATSFAEVLAIPFVDLSFIVVLGLILVTSASLSDEFEKGTIKQLLVKPFNRNKILISKLIACLISVIIFSIYLMVLNVISCAIAGQLGELTRTYITYDWNLNKVVEVNTFQYFLELFKVIPFMYIIMILMIMFASVLFTSTALSGAFGFALIIIPQILSMFINKYKWIAYLPFFSWDMSAYMFGGSSSYKFLNYKLQLFLNIAYIIIFFILNLVAFKKKDVKNQ